MIAAAALEMRKAIVTALLADSILATMLGSAKIHDEAPRNQQPPYVTLGDLRSRDWSTGSDRGAEHILALDVWSSHHGTREALEIADRVATVLEGAALAMTGHRLISLALQSTETRRENGARFMRARQTFRIVTERI